MTWSSADSISLILGGEFTLPFWIGVILLGILLPLAIEGYELFPVILMASEYRESEATGGQRTIFARHKEGAARFRGAQAALY